MNGIKETNCYENQTVCKVDASSLCTAHTEHPAPRQRAQTSSVLSSALVSSKEFREMKSRKLALANHLADRKSVV